MLDITILVWLGVVPLGILSYSLDSLYLFINSSLMLFPWPTHDTAKNERTKAEDRPELISLSHIFVVILSRSMSSHTK